MIQSKRALAVVLVLVLVLADQEPARTPLLTRKGVHHTCDQI